MPSYRVCFINEIPRNEKLFRCCQRPIIIRSARTSDRGRKKKFARLEGIRDWKIHAAPIETEPIEFETKARNATHAQKARRSQKRGVLFKEAYVENRPLRNRPFFTASGLSIRRLEARERCLTL
jgi:hypothetical protein